MSTANTVDLYDDLQWPRSMTVDTSDPDFAVRSSHHQHDQHQQHQHISPSSSASPSPSPSPTPQQQQPPPQLPTTATEFQKYANATTSELVELVDTKAQSTFMRFCELHENTVAKQQRVSRVLQLNASTLDKQIATLAQQKAELEANISALKGPISQMDEWLRQHTQHTPTDPHATAHIDALVTATTVQSAQLLDLVGEDLTIEDTQFYLDKALELGHVDLETWVKATRVLGKTQYKTRALVCKLLDI
eukprot:c9027_g1_i1.p1 GENE.c9027_g1_i1~~c9027_g1_i1.p1  ORF type:complete len:248 (-),score=84.24 c9027_g1_i1:269-1012(-)